MTSEKPNKDVRFSPLEVKKRFKPNRFTAKPKTSMTPRLVATNKRMRFMFQLQEKG